MSDIEKKIKNTNNRRTKQEEMMDASIGKLIFKMALPTILSFLIISIYNLADTYFVSSLGTNATAAVSVNASLDQIVMMGGSMLAVGASTYIARLLGAGDKKRAEQVLSSSVIGAAIFGALILIFGKIFVFPLVRLLGATPTCEQYSVDYANYLLYAAPFMATNFVMSHTLRSEGSALYSMFGMGIGGILNCFLDPLFIFDEFEFLGITFSGLGMAVEGASLATAISKLVSFAILIAPYIRGKSNLRLTPRSLYIDKVMTKEVLSVGTSSLFRNGLAIIAAIVLNNIAGDISDSMLAAVGVAQKVMMFPFGIILGFGQGFQPVAGFSWGAKNYNRVRQSYIFATKVAIIGSVAMGLIMAVFSDQLINLFTEYDADMIRLGSLCIRLQCIALPAHGWVMVVNMLCGSIGYAFGASFLALARQGTCFLPIVYPLAWLFGETGVCMVQAVADVISIFLAIPMIRKIYKMIAIAEEEHKAELTAKFGKDNE